MNPKLPTWIMMAGSFAFLILLVFRPGLGSASIFESIFGIASALAFSIGMFLSHCGLIGRADQRRKFFGLHFFGLLILCSMLGLDFLGYVAMTKMYNVIDETSDILPKLVEGARTADSESKRRTMAQDAYQIYGLTVAYRRDNGELTYYQPTSQDIALHDQYEKNGVKNRESRDSILNGPLRQLPWLFSVYLGSFFSVYLAGSLWLLLRRPEARS